MSSSLLPPLLLLPLLCFGSASASESGGDSNNLCLEHYGPGTYELPCTAPREDWDFAFKDEFVITAWWPPTMNAKI